MLRSANTIIEDEYRKRRPENDPTIAEHERCARESLTQANASDEVKALLPYLMDYPELSEDLDLTSLRLDAEFMDIKIFEEETEAAEEAEAIEEDTMEEDRLRDRKEVLR